MAVGLPTVLVATSTRCRGDVCAHARATRSASAADLRAIEGDMCARECRVREPPPLVRKRFSTTLDAPRSINKFRPASQPKSDEDIVRPNNWRVEAPVWTAREDEFPGEARCRRAACCARSRGPGRRGGRGTSSRAHHGGHLANSRARFWSESVPRDSRVDQNLRLEADRSHGACEFRAFSTCRDFYRLSRGVRAFEPRSRRAIRGARQPNSP